MFGGSGIAEHKVQKLTLLSVQLCFFIAVKDLCMSFLCVCKCDNKLSIYRLLTFSFYQASEQDILKYLIKWGEHQLMKRIADRGKDPLNHTVLNQINQNVWNFFFCG